MPRTPLPRATRGPVLRALGAASCVALLAGCFAGGSRTWDPGSALADQCDDVPADASRATIVSWDDEVLGGALVGDATATTGVVVDYGSTQTLCDWLDDAAQISQRTGASVLLFDRRGTGSSPGDTAMLREPGDVVAAAQWLRNAGAQQVVVMGASLGTVGAWVASVPDGPAQAPEPDQDGAPSLTPAACATVLLSPISGWEGDDGTVTGFAAPGTPAELFVAYETGTSSVVTAVEKMRTTFAGSGYDDVHWLEVDTDDHGIGLYDGHTDVQDMVVEAVEGCTA